MKCGGIQRSRKSNKDRENRVKKERRGKEQSGKGI